MRTDNPARQLYDQMGFSIVGRRPDYYRGKDGKLRDAVTMQRYCC
jgi:ribosomal-protein-alanine N-acetyltransferase